MHFLTKLFVVVQTLLSVLVLGLAIPMAVNKDLWQTKHHEEMEKRTAAEATAQNATLTLSRYQAKKDKDMERLRSDFANLESEVAQQSNYVADLRSNLAGARQAAESAQADLTTLTATVQTQAKIIGDHAQEISQRREESLTLQKRSIELEDMLRETQSSLDVTLVVSRVFQEQIVQLQERLEGQVGEGPGGGKPMETGVVDGPPVAGRILAVTQDASGARYAEIDLGQRDGLTRNMKFFIARDNNFMGFIITTDVDINRAVGRIQLEQGEGISVNDRVMGIGTKR